MSVRDSKGANGVVTISVDGRFDISQQAEFRAAYEKHSASDNFVIDMANSDYLDSSALGMLLQLREFVGNRKDKVALRNCNGRVRDIISVAKFESLFEVE